MKYFVANWKTNKDTAEVRAWQKAVANAPVGLDVMKVVCPSFVHLPLFADLKTWQLGSQTVSAYPNGAYTGAVSAAQLAEFAKFVIVGHVERRKYFFETDQLIAQQVTQAVTNGLTPIVAVDDHNWSHQLGMLANEELAECLVMYEPAEAISTSSGGSAVDVENVKTAIRQIQSKFPAKGFLYGGSVNVDNVADYFQSPIDGVVVGNASLDAAKVLAMLKKI